MEKEGARRALPPSFWSSAALARARVRFGNVNADPTIAAAIETRRTFAIISHPDAGKTTLTEKLLLYGGAIHLAGTVKARRQQRHATSDWMQMEQERGISVTSSVMQFAYEGYQVNLLDTPGHEDFSEDTYRVLIAADAAVMLLDNRKGVEERTRQLFAVCKRRRMPIFTVVNKCDRVGEDPLKLIGDVESDLELDCHPVTWPIHSEGAFIGVYDRRRRLIYRFERGEDHGASRAEVDVASLDDPSIGDMLGAEAHERLVHDIALLDEAGHPFSHEAVLAGTLSPVFFASALTNFGVEPFLREFVELAPPPTARGPALTVLLPHRADNLRLQPLPREFRRPPPPPDGARSIDGARRSRRSRLQRFRVQDPGEHGSEAPRSRRVRARLLRTFHPRVAGDARAHGQADASLLGAAVPRPRALGGGGSVAWRRDRRDGPRHPSHRRHPRRR